jgi:hypothetical protein
MTDDLVKRWDDLDTILETEFDTQLSVQRNPYWATKAIEDALYLLRDQAARLEALHDPEVRRWQGLFDEKHNLMLEQKARAEKAEAENDRAWAALWDILACETPNANATVTRMAAIAKAALKGETRD